MWRSTSPILPIGPSFANESTPLMIGGALYTSTSLSQVAAIDAATGVTRWVFDPKIYENGLGMPPNLGWLNRGVAYWRNGDDERIVILTAFAQMIALECQNRRGGARLRHRWPGRSHAGPAPAGRSRLLHHDVTASDRARGDRRWVIGL